MMFLEMTVWKRLLLNELNVGVLDEAEWKRFIAAARLTRFDAMAADMQKRLDHYTKNTLEKK